MPLPLAQQRSHENQLISSPAGRLYVETRASGRGSFAPARDNKIHAPLPVRFWHLASLDAPTVAIVWCAAFAWAARVRLPWWVLVLIPLGAWSVYITDRLLDARGEIKSPNLDRLRDRHVFHWRHRGIFIPLAAASALAAACIICKRVPRNIRENDSVLALASLAYFARVHSKRAGFAPFSKEFLVGILFTLGCVLPTWSREQFSGAASLWQVLIVTAIFGGLAWLNCAAIDRWESHDRRGDSIAQLGILLACASSICAFALARDHHARVASLLACVTISALLLALLDRYRNRLTPITLRCAADLVLLMPSVLLTCAALIRR